MADAHYTQLIHTAEEQLLRFLRTFESIQEHIRFDKIGDSQAELQAVTGDMFSALADELAGRIEAPAMYLETVAPDDSEVTVPAERPRSRKAHLRGIEADLWPRGIRRGVELPAVSPRPSAAPDHDEVAVLISPHER